MQTEDTRFRPETPVEKKVASSSWRLANRHAYRTISLSLGMGVSAVIKYTHDFCDILCALRKDFIWIPNINELSPIIRKFGAKSIDGSHIPIKTPLQNNEDYLPI